eukprot:g7725.t2
MTKTSKVKVKPSPAAAVDGKRGDSGALTVTATAANRSTPGEAAAGTARAVSGGPSGRRVRGAGIVERTAGMDADRASTGTSSTSTSTSTASSSDEDMSAAGGSAAARVKAVKAAHQAPKKAARASAAAAPAAAAASADGNGGGGGAAAAPAAAAVADNACITHNFSTVEPTTNTACRRQQQQQQEQPARRTSGSLEKHKEGKEQRAYTKSCTFFLRGRCRYGDRCRFSHDVVHESDGKEKEGGEEEKEEEEEGEDAIATMEAALDEAERIQSRNEECGVCLEVVSKREGTKERTFGILMGCRHVYCLSCITEWRDKVVRGIQSKSHECSECRVPSPLVVPRKTVVTDPERKARLVSNFRILSQASA